MKTAENQYADKLERDAAAAVTDNNTETRNLDTRLFKNQLVGTLA
ncbi:hypothetical protein [Blautia sp.]